MYLLTIEALATSIKQIIEYVNSEHFKDMLADVLGKDVEVTGPTSLEFEVMGSESPKGTSPLAPSKGASPTAVTNSVVLRGRAADPSTFSNGQGMAIDLASVE